MFSTAYKIASLAKTVLIDDDYKAAQVASKPLTLCIDFSLPILCHRKLNLNFFDTQKKSA